MKRSAAAQCIKPQTGFYFSTPNRITVGEFQTGPIGAIHRGCSAPSRDMDRPTGKKLYCRSSIALITARWNLTLAMVSDCSIMEQRISST